LTLEFPVFVVELTERVRVVVPELPGDTFTLVGLKLAVAPPGKPFALRVTVPANPLDDVIVMVVVPLLVLEERLTVTVAGLTVMLILPPTLTVNERLVEWLRVPLVPVTVMVYVPAGVPLGVSVKLELPDPLIVLGLKTVAKPAGRVPVKLRATLPVKPLSAPTLICALVLCPCFVDAFEAAIVKSGGRTISVTTAAWLRAPEVPVIARL